MKHCADNVDSCPRLHRTKHGQMLSAAGKQFTLDPGNSDTMHLHRRWRRDPEQIVLTEQASQATQHVAGAKSFVYMVCQHMLCMHAYQLAWMSWLQEVGKVPLLLLLGSNTYLICNTIKRCAETSEVVLSRTYKPVHKQARSCSMLTCCTLPICRKGSH